MDRFSGEFFVHHIPHAFAAAFDCNRQRPAAPFCKDSSQFRGHGGRTHRADADTRVVKPILIQPLQQIAELGVLGHGRSQQTETSGRLHPFFNGWNQAVIKGWGAERQGEIARQAEAAQFRTAAHHLHHVDVRPGCVRRDHRRMAEGVAPPGLFLHKTGDVGIHRLHGKQCSRLVVTRNVEAGHVDPLHHGQSPEAFGSWCMAALLQGIDEGTEQQFAIAQKHSIEERGQGFRVGGENRTATEHDRIVIAAVFGPDRNVLVLQQFRKNRSIELPAQRQSEQIAVSGQRVSLVRE